MFTTVLRAVLTILCLEVLLLVATLHFSNVTGQLNQNAADILQKQTGNRQGYLQSTLLAAQDLDVLEDRVNTAAADLLSAGAIRLDTLDRSSADALPLLEAVSGSLISTLRQRSVTGVFIVLNTHDLDSLAALTNLPCVYLRDLDPTTTPSARNSDISMEISPAELVQSLHISTDTCWTPALTYDPAEPADFLYAPFQAAFTGSEQADAADYGRWTTAPYALAGDEAHPAVAYSMPLVLPDGTVYGVVGIEMLESHLRSILPFGELLSDGSGAYILAVADAPEENGVLTAKEVFCTSGDASGCPPGSELTLSASENGGYRMEVEGSWYHAAVIPLNLYSRNAPFSGDQFLLIGAAPEAHLFAFSNSVLTMLGLAVVLMFLVGAAASLLVAYRLARPITRLSDQVAAARKNPDAIPTLSPTGVRELDRFSSAFTQLSREVLDTSTKFLRIMDMASVELGGYEVRTDPPSVYVTDNFFALLDMPKVPAGELTVPRLLDILVRLDRDFAHSAAPDGAVLYEIPLSDGDTRYLRVETTYEGPAQVGLVEDVTASTLEKMRIEHERDHDPLTGLLSRQAFQRECEALFLHPRRLGCAALVMLDLDNLKHTNDAFGHDWGDAYIRQVGQCFARCAPPRSLCARISGDEFNLLLYGYSSKEEVRRVLHELHEAMGKTSLYLPTGRELRVSISGGVAWYPADSTQLSGLRKYADFAMYQVKKTRKGDLAEFDPVLYQQSIQTRQMRRDFQRLIREELVTYHFQPIVSAVTGRVEAYEALMRAKLSTLANPAEVLRLAREEDCLHEIERITLFRSAADFTARIESGDIPPGRKVFINSIASQCLTQEETAEFTRRFSALLPQMVIEITEEEDLDPAALAYKRAAFGHPASFALDDYGSGYSNDLGLLSIAPDYIKVDLSIIRDIDTDTDKQQIVSNIVSYAHQRSMKIVAEGLETPAEVRKVLELGVDLLQGYFLAKPGEIPPAVSPAALELIAAFPRPD